MNGSLIFTPLFAQIWSPPTPEGYTGAGSLAATSSTMFTTQSLTVFVCFLVLKTDLNNELKEQFVTTSDTFQISHC